MGHASPTGPSRGEVPSHWKLHAIDHKYGVLFLQFTTTSRYVHGREMNSQSICVFDPLVVDLSKCKSTMIHGRTKPKKSNVADVKVESYGRLSIFSQGNSRVQKKHEGWFFSKSSIHAALKPRIDSSKVHRPHRVCVRGLFDTTHKDNEVCLEAIVVERKMEMERLGRE